MKRQQYRTATVLIGICILFLPGWIFAQLPMDAVIIPKAQSRSYMLTNEGSSFLFAETGGYNTSLMQGFHVRTEEYLEDFMLEVDGKVIRRENAEALLYPTKLVRKYETPELEEEVTLLDSMPVLSIKIKAKAKHTLGFVPVVPATDKKDNLRQVWSTDDNMLFFSTQVRMQKANLSQYPKLAGICTFPAAEYKNISNARLVSYDSKVKQEVFIPGKIVIPLDDISYIFVIVGENKADILKKRKKVLQQLNIYFEKSGRKINGVRQT